MDELKQARERRASSARAGGAAEPDRQFRAQFEEWREEQDDRPFWERDDPFGSDGYNPERSEAAQESAAPRRRAQYEEPAGEEWPREERRRAEPSVDADRSHRTQSRPGRGGGGGRRPPEDGPRRKAAEREGRSGAGQQTRQHASAARAPKSRAGLLMLMTLLGLLALAVFIGMKVFEITAITVQGNDTMKAEDVVKLAGITKGENIFRVNLGQAQRNLESDPLVEVLGISRIFPDKIKIVIHQRKPHGAIAYMGSYVIIDENGVVLDERQDLPAGQYPLITGIDIKPAEKGQPVTGLDKAVMQTMKKLLTALYDNNAITCVSEANLSDPGVIRLLTAEGLQIDAGKPTDLDNKAHSIAYSVPKLREEGHTSGILYVYGNADPVYSESGSGGQDQQ